MSEPALRVFPCRCVAASGLGAGGVRPPRLEDAGALVVSSRGAHLAAADGTEIAHLSAAGGLRAGVVAEDAAMADVWSTEPRARCRVSLAGGAAAAAEVVSCVEALVAVAGRYLDGVGGAQGAARERAGGDGRRRADDAAFEQLWRRAGALALAPRVGGGDLEGISDEHSDSDSEYTSSSSDDGSEYGRRRGRRRKGKKGGGFASVVTAAVSRLRGGGGDSDDVLGSWAAWLLHPLSLVEVPVDLDMDKEGLAIATEEGVLLLEAPWSRVKGARRDDPSVPGLTFRLATGGGAERSLRVRLDGAEAAAEAEACAAEGVAMAAAGQRRWLAGAASSLSRAADKARKQRQGRRRRRRRDKGGGKPNDIDGYGEADTWDAEGSLRAILRELADAPGDARTQEAGLAALLGALRPGEGEGKKKGAVKGKGKGGDTRGSLHRALSAADATAAVDATLGALAACPRALRVQWYGVRCLGALRRSSKAAGALASRTPAAALLARAARRLASDADVQSECAALLGALLRGGAVPRAALGEVTDAAASALAAHSRDGRVASSVLYVLALALAAAAENSGAYGDEAAALPARVVAAGGAALIAGVMGRHEGLLPAQQAGCAALAVLARAEQEILTGAGAAPLPPAARASALSAAGAVASAVRRFPGDPHVRGVAAMLSPAQ